jgi:hypothetical protein
MEMFLMALCMSVFGLGVAAAAFGTATRSKSPDSAVQPHAPLVKAAAPARFFSDQVALPAVPPVVPVSQVPIEVLLLQLENYVRMEQAAAESFIAFPSQERLHTKTTSSFVN